MATVQELRLNNLRELIKEHGGASELARKAGYSAPSYLMQMAGPNPTRKISEDTARQIETKLSLRPGSLDEDKQMEINKPVMGLFAGLEQPHQAEETAPRFQFRPFPTIDGRTSELLPYLPEPLKRYVWLNLLIKHTPYAFSYASNRVIVSAISIREHTLNLKDRHIVSSIRLLMYRNTIALRHMDPTPFIDRHYLMAIITNRQEEMTIPSFLVREAAMLDMYIETFKSNQEVADRIVTLESSPTPLDEMMADQPDHWDDDGEYPDI